MEAQEAPENVVEASQIVGETKAAETPGAAPVAKKAEEKAVEASQIVGALEVAETPGAAKVAARIVVKSAEAGDDSDAGDSASYRAALPSPIVGSIEESDSLGPEEAAPHRAALLRSGTPDLDPELEEFLSNTPEPDTPSVRSPTLGAARIPVEAANEPIENMEAVVDRLQAIVEELLPWLKDDLSSSVSSNPRTSSPDIELEDISEFEEAAQRDPDPGQLNEIFEFRDPEPEQLNEMFDFEEAA